MEQQQTDSIDTTYITQDSYLFLMVMGLWWSRVKACFAAQPLICGGFSNQPSADDGLWRRPTSNLPAGNYYPLQDLLYRNTAMTDSAGTIVETYGTDAYGNTLIFKSAGTNDSWWADDAV